MSNTPRPETILRVAELPQRKPHKFSITGDSDQCDKVAKALDLTALRKLSFVGTLQATGKDDWHLKAQLGASVVQPCVVTLAPVTTRIDQKVERYFLRNWVDPIESEELEMPEDDTTEPLTPEIDLIAVLTEALALALPDYPKAPEANLEQATFAADGVTPMSDDDIKPFASLAALKEKLEKPPE